MRTGFTIFLFFLCTDLVHSQNSDSAFITSLQNEIAATAWRSPEKFYISTDRPWYLAGEEIWFKLNITTNGLPFTNSGVLYVSLADSTGHILFKKILPIDDNAVSYGSLKLPIELKKGWYSLGVQTEWNRNFNDGFEKLIYINEKGEIPSAISFSNYDSQKENSVEFFPEGGTFVAGLQNHFGVMAKNKNGEPVMVKGTIIDNNSTDTLAIFETSSAGSGEFTLPATTSGHLSANIYWPEGNMTIQTFPQMQSAGMTLQASLVGEELFYKIESFPGWFAQTSDIVFVIIMHGEILFSKAFRNTADLTSYSNHFSLAEFPNGIISLRLYTNEGKEIAQRDIYHYKEKKVLLNKEQIGFEPKAKNEIEIVLPDTLNGTYSISITDADLAEELMADEKETSSNEKAMNLYLLARNNISNDTAPPFKFAYQQGINISGELYYSKTSKPVSNKTINFFPRNSSFGSFLLSDSLDDNGDFQLKDLFIEDSTVLCWNINGLNNNELNKIKLKLNGNWFDSMTMRSTVLKKKIIKEDADTNTKPIVNALKNYFTVDSLEKKKTKTLPEVTIYAQQRKRIEELDKTYASTSLFGARLGEALVFDIEEEKTFYPNIVSFLEGRIPDLKVMGPTYNPLLMYRSTGHPMSGAPITNVAVFINENRAEASDIATLSVSEIGYVKVFKPPYTYILVTPNKPGEKPPALVIAIYIKKNSSKIISGPIPSAFQSFSLKGFSLPASFPLPDYSETKEMESIPDKRITLYWDPEMNFINGKAKIIFFNNDFTKRYLIKLEGINELGEIVRYRQIIEK